jgi:hypothetical protein
MNRLIAILALSTALGVAACDDPGPGDSTYADAPMEEAPMALPAEDAGEPVIEPAAPTQPSMEAPTPPPENPTSAESVKPESETLFY